MKLIRTLFRSTLYDTNNVVAFRKPLALGAIAMTLKDGSCQLALSDAARFPILLANGLCIIGTALVTTASNVAHKKETAWTPDASASLICVLLYEHRGEWLRTLSEWESQEIAMSASARKGILVSIRIHTIQAADW
jgi:hypothetical protein